MDHYFYAYQHARSSTVSDPFASRLVNFGIDNLYAPTNTYDGRCLLGINFLLMSEQQITLTYIAMTSYPIQTSFDLIALSGLGLYAMNQFSFTCVIEPYDYQQTCQNIYEFLYCIECTNQYCLECETGTLLNGVCITIVGCLEVFTT
jgi:hypothetical protein